MAQTPGCHLVCPCHLVDGGLHLLTLHPNMCSLEPLSPPRCGTSLPSHQLHSFQSCNIPEHQSLQGSGFSSGRTKNKAAGFVETQVQQFLDDQIAHVEEGTPQIPGPTQVAFQWRLGPDVPSAARSSAVQAPASTRSSFGASSGPEAEGRLCLRGAD